MRNLHTSAPATQPMCDHVIVPDNAFVILISLPDLRDVFGTIDQDICIFVFFTKTGFNENYYSFLMKFIR